MQLQNQRRLTKLSQAEHREDRVTHRITESATDPGLRGWKISKTRWRTTEWRMQQCQVQDTYARLQRSSSRTRRRIRTHDPPLLLLNILQVFPQHVPSCISRVREFPPSIQLLHARSRCKQFHNLSNIWSVVAKGKSVLCEVSANRNYWPYTDNGCKRPIFNAGYFSF